MNDVNGQVETRERKQGGKRRGMVRFRFAYVVLLVLMGLFAYAFLQKTQEIQRLSAQQAALLAENERVAQDNNQTWRANRYYRTRQYELDAARSMGWTAPGETSIQVNPIHHPVEVVRQAVTRPLVPPKPAWQQWWDAFFD